MNLYEIRMSGFRRELNALLDRVYMAGEADGETAAMVKAEAMARKDGADALADKIKDLREIPF